jgi:hypothetical protein
MPLNAAIVGTVAEPVVHAVDARWLMAYAAGLGETLPCYLDTRLPEGIQAHPLLGSIQDTCRKVSQAMESQEK